VIYTFIQALLFEVYVNVLRARIDPVTSIPRLVVQVFLAAQLAAFANFASAKSIEPPSGWHVTQSLAIFSEPDLMETAYREGITRYEEGEYIEAVRVWAAPAKYGHAGAQFSLGVAYAAGNGVNQDLTSAIRWWKMAAYQGHSAAQLNLGILYWRGVGVERDLEQARSWWRRAADRGDAAAQFHLGALAATGEGSPIDFNDAIHWWRLSAAQGYQLAIEGLQIMERHGIGVGVSLEPPSAEY